nr:hypothetical protein [Bradyrhizobium forestalis]
MSFRFLEDHRDAYPVRLMYAVLDFSPAGYYAWRDRPLSERTKSNAALLAASGKSIKTAAAATAVLASMRFCAGRAEVSVAARSRNCPYGQ